MKKIQWKGSDFILLSTKAKTIILGTIMFTILINNKFPYLHIEKEKVKTVEINKDNNYIYENVILDKVSDKNYVDVQKNILSSLGEVKTEEKEIKIEPEWIDIIATGYCNCYKCTQNTKNKGITASGIRASRGTIAMPKEYKFNTKLFIESLGEFTNHDTGDAIKQIDQNTINVDVWFPTHQEALDFGKRKLRGHIIK